MEDELMKRIEELVTAQPIDYEKLGSSAAALQHRFGDVLADLGVSALTPFVYLLEDGVAVKFPTIDGRRAIDTLLCRLEDIVKVQKRFGIDDVQLTQNTSLL